MRIVFSSNNLSETVLIRDAIARRGIDVMIQNAYAGHSAVPEFRPAVEICVVDDADYNLARRTVEETLSTIDSKIEGEPWDCPACKTDNPASFELCWNCGEARTVTTR